MSRFLALVVMAAWSTDGLAAWPDDVSLDALSRTSDPEIRRANYDQVVRELGAAVANKPAGPANTLGAYGFEFTFSSTLAFIETSGTTSESSPWMNVHEEGDPSGAMWIPSLGVQKGLPASVDVGANLGYVAFSRQTVFGAYGRWSPVEGYPELPDVSLQVGYSGYIGNDQLELGVMDIAGTVSYTFPFARFAGVSSGSIAPYAGFGGLVIHAMPLMDEDEQLALGVAPVSGFKKSDDFVEDFRPLQFHLGFRVVSGPFELKLAGTIANKVLPALNLGVGFLY